MHKKTNLSLILLVCFGYGILSACPVTINPGPDTSPSPEISASASAPSVSTPEPHSSPSISNPEPSASSPAQPSSNPEPSSSANSSPSPGSSPSASPSASSASSSNSGGSTSGGTQINGNVNVDINLNQPEHVLEISSLEEPVSGTKSPSQIDILAGQNIRINGFSFKEGASVKFLFPDSEEREAGTVVINNLNTITAQLKQYPSVATVDGVKVKVTVNGKTVTSTQSFRYITFEF